MLIYFRCFFYVEKQNHIWLVYSWYLIKTVTMNVRPQMSDLWRRLYATRVFIFAHYFRVLDDLICVVMFLVFFLRIIYKLMSRTKVLTNKG